MALDRPDRANIPMLLCSNVAIERNGQSLLEGVNLTLEPGALLALVAPNGSGKTTLLETLAGALPLAAGQIEFAGHRIERLPVHARARRGVRLIPDRNMVFANLSVAENLSMGARKLEVQGAPRAAEIKVLATLRQMQKAGALSGGQKRILATCSALRAQPRLLLGDEFSEGLQHGVVEQLLGQVRELCREGAIAILVLHSEAFAREKGIPALTIQRKRLVCLS
jgi:branched-chain amino acid transport system ATP-binding protein